MKVFRKIGHVSSYNSNHKKIDFINFEWFETQKRIANKRSTLGETIQIKFLNENPIFTEGDILYESDTQIGVVQILPCECLVIQPKNNYELAAACFEIGNRHIPLFMDNNDLLVAFEKPLSRYFEALGFNIKKEERKLLNPLKTTVTPHGDNKSLFTKIMQLTQPTT